MDGRRTKDEGRFVVGRLSSVTGRRLSDVRQPSAVSRRRLSFVVRRSSVIGLVLFLSLALLPASIQAAPPMDIWYGEALDECKAPPTSCDELATSDGCVRPPVECNDPEAIAGWVDAEALPIPTGPQRPLSWYMAQGPAGWSSFRTPFPPVPVWNPPGTKRVGLQAGHWLYDEAPDELADLRRNPGTSGGGRAEWEVNLDIAERTAAILREAGVEADVLPTTIPVRYRAHAFVAIHADGDVTGTLTGYKNARPFFSSVPEVDDAFVDLLNEEYGQATGLSRQDNQISGRMRGYYAFNARRYRHAVAPGVPQAIVETGFLTSAADRRLLLGDPDRAARGIANGILKFLEQDLR